MPRPSIHTLITKALQARGYSQHRFDPMRDPWECWSISPTHKRRISDKAVKLWFNHKGAMRQGSPWGDPLPQATRTSLALEGQSLWRPVTSLAELGL